ncbi:MAG: response regulator [Gemmatimonadaceae bacterium]|nr:response regulator [Gemmatimonadaceae bacterium]
MLLPLQHAVDAEAVDEPAPRRAAAGVGRILLAEDDAAVRASTERILAQAGYRVVAAADGPSALHQLRAASESFDLLLTDVVMPGMSGTELARRVKELQPDIALLYVSGYADDPALHASVASSGVVCIAKPFTIHTLLDAARDAIALRTAALGT